MTLSCTHAPAYPALPAAFNMAAHVLAMATTNADQPALELLHPDHTEVWTYGQIQAAIAGVATGLLATGLVPGDRVLMRLGNSFEFPVLFLAAITAGLIPVPTSAMLTGPEVAKLCDLVTPALIVADADVAIPAQPPCPVLPAAALAAMHSLTPHPFALGDPNRLAYIIFTSGTSGRLAGGGPRPSRHFGPRHDVARVVRAYPQ